MTASKIGKWLERVFSIKLVEDSHKKGYVDGMSHLPYGVAVGLLMVVLVPSFLGAGLVGLAIVFLGLELYQSHKCVGCNEKETINPLTWRRNRWQDFYMPIVGYLVVVGLWHILKG